jgi:hypothetical protein
VAKQFRYSGCRTNERDPACAFYEFTMSFDFAGTYKAKVMALAQATQLAQIQKDLIFVVQGLGDMALPVSPASASSISWAESLRDRDAALPLFDKNLAQTVPSLFLRTASYFFLFFPSFLPSFHPPLLLGSSTGHRQTDDAIDTPHVARARTTHHNNRCRPTREQRTGWACSRACLTASRAGGSASGRR